MSNADPVPPARPQSRRKHSHRKRWLWIAAAFAVVLLFSAVSWRLYPRWKQTRLIAVAQAAVARSDFRTAAVSARQVLLANPVQLDACKIMVVCAGESRSPQEIYWRRRVAELEPGVPAHFHRWLAAAVQHRQPASAEEALAAMPVSLRSTSLYFQMAAAVATLRGDHAGAIREYAEAVKREPENEPLRLSLATLRLQSTNAAERAGAAADMEKFRTGATRLEATRALVGHALREDAPARALPLGADLKADARAVFADRLLHLTVLRRSSAREFDAELAELKTLAAQRTNAVLELATWLHGHRLLDDAREWLGSLPSPLRATRPVQMALADSALLRSDWRALAELLASCAWDELELMRFALLSRAQRGLGDRSAATLSWGEAARCAGGNPEAFQLLAGLAASWGWEPESEELWWNAVRAMKDPRPVLARLNQHYFTTGNAAGMLRVAQRAAELNPADDYNRNNLLSLTALLGLANADTERQARELHAKAPANAAFATTCAFVLHTLGRTPDGLEVLKKISAAALEIPELAAYHGILLAANNDLEPARRALTLGNSAKLLAQEKALVDEARRKVGME